MVEGDRGADPGRQPSEPNADVGPLREDRGNHQILGPDRWEKGKVYVDEQTFRVPNDVTGAEVSILVGVWKGDSRLRIVSGPNDGDNSAIVGKIKTGVTPKAEEQHTANDVPALAVGKLAKKALGYSTRACCQARSSFVHSTP